MQVVSNEFREKVYSGEALYTANLTINGQQVPINQIARITIKSPIIDTSTETFYVGSFISQSITIKFKNLDGIDIQSGNLVYLEIGEYVNDEYEYVPIGYFLIEEPKENYQETCEITCLDYAIKFKPNIDYSPCFTDGKANINVIAQYICDYFGVELETDLSQLPNSQIEVGTYDSSISGKQWLSYIAETKGCNLKINRQGKLMFIPLKHEPDITINTLKSEKLELGEKYQVSRVVYFDAVRNFTYGEDSNNTLFIRQDNPFITDETVVQNIYNAVENFTVWSLKNRNYGDISLDAWDIINFTLGYDENENPIEYQTYNDNTIVYEMNIMTDISTQIPTKQKEITTNVVGGDEETKVKMIKTLLDYVNAEVTIQAEEQKNMQNRLAQLILDVNSIQNLFQITGGNNLIKNSQFLFNDETWEFGDIEMVNVVYNDQQVQYDGNDVVYGLNNLNLKYHTPFGEGYDSSLIGQTTSISKIQLRNIVMSSKSDNIINLKQGQAYTLSYLFKQDPLTTTRVQLIEQVSGLTIYNKHFNSSVDNITEETFQFIANDNSYILRISTTTLTNDDTKGYFYIYDLMLNSGDKKNWEVAAGEIYSTVIKMSQLGLQVLATGSKIATLITSDGFKIYKYENGQLSSTPITEFTDDGLITGIAKTLSVYTGRYVMTELYLNGIEHHVEYFKE